MVWAGKNLKHHLVPTPVQGVFPDQSRSTSITWTWTPKLPTYLGCCCILLQCRWLGYFFCKFSVGPLQELDLSKAVEDRSNHSVHAALLQKLTPTAQPDHWKVCSHWSVQHCLESLRNNGFQRSAGLHTFWLCWHSSSMKKHIHALSSFPPSVFMLLYCGTAIP